MEFSSRGGPACGSSDVKSEYLRSSGREGRGASGFIIADSMCGNTAVAVHERSKKLEGSEVRGQRSEAAKGGCAMCEV